MVKGNLTYREDTGTVNSSPVVNMPPTIHLQYGCYHAIKIPGRAPCMSMDHNNVKFTKFGHSCVNDIVQTWSIVYMVTAFIEHV